MEIKKTMIPFNSHGEAMGAEYEWEYIYFTVTFNGYRDVSDDITHVVRDRVELAETEAVLCLPKSYKADGAETPLILSCHGAGGRVCAAEGTVGGVPYAIECLKAGYAVLDVCGSKPHGLTMGCPEHLQALYKAYRYAVTHYNLSDRVLVAGASMGGHVAMNFANTYPSIVLALGLIYPRLNIDGVMIGEHYSIGTWDKTTKNAEGISTKDRILEVYRFPSEEWCEERVTGFNPYRTRSFVNAAGERVVIPPCPIKIWQGTADTTVDPEMVKEFVASVRRGGCYIELHLLDGVAHKITPVMREELPMWFDRFI